MLSLFKSCLFKTPWTIPDRLLCPWDFLGKNTGVGYHFLLQGIFLIQGLNLCPALAGRFFTTEPPGSWSSALKISSYFWKPKRQRIVSLMCLSTSLLVSSTLAMFNCPGHSLLTMSPLMLQIHCVLHLSAGEMAQFFRKTNLLPRQCGKVWGRE